MKISTAIATLQNLLRWHGDIELYAEFCGDDQIDFVPLDDEANVVGPDGKAICVFVEGVMADE